MKTRPAPRSVWMARALLLALLIALVSACGPTPAHTPVAEQTRTRASVTAASPAATRQEATPTLVVSTPTPPGATSFPEAPVSTATLEATSLVAPNAQGMQAWGVAGDGAVYVLDAAAVVHELAPHSLAPIAQSPPLFEPRPDAAAYLTVSEDYVFIASGSLSQTLALDRDSLRTAAQLMAFGPMAVEPGQRLFMIPQELETQWPFGNFEIWAYDLKSLDQPPTRVRYTGAALNDLTIDPEAGRLYALASNYNASPPHQGQHYEVFGLDVLTRTASFEWERGSLTRPVIHPMSGEVLGSRIGLNLTRRFLIFDSEGNEVRSLPSVDGQPAVDPDGEWIYLLRQRGLWVLREKDLSVQAMLPFDGAPPEDLALSPEGKSLYLLGNGWLASLPVTELLSQGIAPISPLPMAWFDPEQAKEEMLPRLYPSPHMEEDDTAFLQMVSGAMNVFETYYTEDGGQSWRLVEALVDPSLAGATHLGLSPDLNQDRTMTAQVGSGLVRSTDRGLTWERWQSRIAFTSERGGDRDIYTMDADGGDVQQLTFHTAADENAAWSPAWTRLAFQSDRNGNWDIFDLRVGCDEDEQSPEEVCDQRQLTDDGADDLLPAWSPDGRTIAFVSTRDGNPEIYVMDSNGQNQRRLTFHPGGDWRPAWLPDSRHLVFASDRSGNNDIYKLAVPNLEDGPLDSEPEIRAIAASSADDRDPAVMTTYLDKLLFLSDRDGIWRTYYQNLGYESISAFAQTETERPEAHPATLPAETSWILVSSERDGPSNIYRAILDEYIPMAPSTAFDGQPAAEATAWRPEPEASLSWLEELQE
jgi:hypothetical protein